INHFPQQAASGGPIGILNVDFIRDVTFLTGGFNATFGDKLSSIMDIKFREGNRNEFDGQLDLNWAGFGGVAEGPLFSEKGSWLFSARRSYLDYVINWFDVGSSIAPIYGDLQGKVVLDLNTNHKLTLLGIFSEDHNAPDRETAEENFMTHFGRQDLIQRTVGMNWQAIWGKHGYSNVSLAATVNNYDEDWYETTTGKYDVKNRTSEQMIKFRNINHFKINKNHSVEFGVEAKRITEKYNNWYAASTNTTGENVPELYLEKEITAHLVGGFLNYIVNPVNRLTITAGLRTDFFSYTENTVISPRFGSHYQLTQKTAINFSTGIFYQHLPLLLLSQNESFKNLKSLKAIHYILGIEHLITENTKLTIEVYQKNYRNFPLDPQQPAIFVIDQDFFNNYQQLLDKGKAESKGIELMIQKKLAQNVYGLVSFAYFKSRYLGLDNEWRDRSYDNRVTFSLEGGYKPNKKWEFSMRWIYAGGVPYTPIDIEKSKLNHRAVYDEHRVNEIRYPDYHSMNLRVDRRFLLSKSNIVFYFSVWNAYNRKNVANYFWNDKRQKQEKVYQWGVLPIFGVEWEF
ncbi:MAG: TonB-dependent receptor, partial [Calditrichaeota bacterium]|nr:TonB-dependent receptor [Calditrichota bacterium]